MTSITQKIPNYIGGISQQPDELMPLGSVRDAVNVFPDVTDGLRKRAGSRLVNPLVTEPDGTWFHFNYADNQKYIGCIQRDGQVKMFNCADGLPIPVYYGTWEFDGLPTTGYPNCDIAALTASKTAWQDKQKEINEKELIYNNLVGDQAADAQNPPRKIFYDVKLDYVTVRFPPGYTSYEDWLSDDNYTGDTNYPREEDRFTLFEGYIRKSGSDIQVPTNVPGGYDSLVRGSRKETDVTVYYKGNKYENVDLYEMVAVKDNSTGDAEIDELKDELTALRAELDQLYAAYQDEASKCGYGANPSLRAIIQTNTVPQYLTQDGSNQIKTLTVGNTVFFCNPRVPTAMLSGSAYNDNRTENFIEVTAAAPNKVYTLYCKTESSEVTPYTRVLDAEVVNGKYTVDDDQTCELQATETEVFNEGDKTNLRLRLTVRGLREVEGDATSPEYKCNYEANVEVLNPGKDWQVGDTVQMEAGGKTYTILINKTETFYTDAEDLIEPDITPDGTNVSADTILKELEAAIVAYNSDFFVKRIGNGLYVTHTDPNFVFSFSTPETAIMNIVTNEVNNIADLPSQCRGGYRVKIANTDSDFDDYYAVFETEFDGLDGPGAWVETVAPDINTVINPAFMPHQMRRNRDGSFTVSPVEWEPMLVGDEKTNPPPSFISQPGSDGRCYINNMAFFRNRLCMLSGDNVICSRPGDFFNFWNGSALAQVDNDPIDIAVGTTGSDANAVLYDSMEVSDGLVVFTGDQQFLLSTDSEVLSPKNARFNRIGTYRYTGAELRQIRQPDGRLYEVYRGVPVFSMGTSIGFTSNAGLHTRVMEMYDISRSGQANVNELTKPVSRLIPYGVNLVASSKDNQFLAVANQNTKDIWVYRYFDNDKERLQSSWFRWTMLGDLIYMCVMDDVLWTVSIAQSSSDVNNQADIVTLQRIDLKDELATAFVEDKYVPSTVVGDIDLRAENGKPYQAHLDNYRIAQPSEATVYTHFATGDGVQTYFRAPLIYFADEVDKGNLVAYMLSPTLFQRNGSDSVGGDDDLYGPGKRYYFEQIGSKIPVRVEQDNMGTWFVMDGDWSNTRMMIGYQYNMKVEFPTIYPTKTTNRGMNSITLSDTRSSLTIHRAKLNFGQVGVYETTVKVLGRDDYTELYESSIPDAYPANEVAFLQEWTQNVSIYAENKITKLILSSTHPSPCTLQSMEWEGDYTNMYYKRA